MKEKHYVRLTDEFYDERVNFYSVDRKLISERKENFEQDAFNLGSDYDCIIDDINELNAQIDKLKKELIELNCSLGEKEYIADNDITRANYLSKYRQNINNDYKKGIISSDTANYINVDITNKLKQIKKHGRKLQEDISYLQKIKIDLEKSINEKKKKRKELILKAKNISYDMKKAKQNIKVCDYNLHQLNIVNKTVDDLYASIQDTVLIPEEVFVPKTKKYKK